MDEQLVGTLELLDYKAEIYSTAVPGEFRVAYLDSKGETVEETPLTGISSYHQREADIKERLKQLKEGAPPQRTPNLGDSGEYK